MRATRFWRRRKVISVWLAAVVVALVTTLAGCNEDDIERVLGEMSAQSVESSYRVVRDPLLNAWINNIGQTEVAYCTRQHIPYEFKILDTDLVNAFAAPYGHIYVTTGLLEFAEDEDEIWGVVGHEIGHVVNRDAIKSVKEGFLFNLGVMILSRKSRTLGNVAGIGLGLLSLRHSRKDEYAADDWGTRLAYLAGHNPAGDVMFFDRLFKKLERGHRPCTLEVMFATHPPTERRIRRQYNRPELLAEDPNILLHIARGQMKQGRYAKALGYLHKAADLAPRSPVVLAALGEALAARGQWAKAAEKYRDALAAMPHDRYIQHRLAAVADNHPPTVMAVTAAEQAQARAALNEMELLLTRTGTARVQVQGAVQRVKTQSETVADTARNIMQSLLDLGGQSVELTPSAQEALLAINAAVSKASDPVFTLERLGPLLDDTATELQSLASEGIAVLQAASEGNGQAGEVAIATRSLREVEAALDELAEAADAAVDAAPDAERAQRLARDAVVVAEQLMAASRKLAREQHELRAAQSRVKQAEEESDDALRALRRSISYRQHRIMMAEMELSSIISRVHTATEATQRAAEAAWNRVREARRTALTARTRVLVARLNLMAIGKPPSIEQAINQLVAYFTMSTPDQVAAVRSKGLGVGDTAAVMAASKSVGVDPLDLAGASNTDVHDSIVGRILRVDRNLLGPRVMLKFLATALAEEVKQPTQ